MTDPLAYLSSSQGRLLLTYSNDLSGNASPCSAKTAFKRYPKEFMELYEEMRILVERRRKEGQEQQKLF